MKVALDTNVLAYAAGIDDAERRDQANRLIRLLDPTAVVFASQVSSELYNVLIKKGQLSRLEALTIVNRWSDLFELRSADRRTFSDALTLATDRDLQVWDAVVLATAAQTGCALLLSEDLQEGFAYRGVTVVNPFATVHHPLMVRLLASCDERL